MPLDTGLPALSRPSHPLVCRQPLNTSMRLYLGAACFVGEISLDNMEVALKLNQEDNGSPPENQPAKHPPQRRLA